MHLIYYPNTLPRVYYQPVRHPSTPVIVNRAVISPPYSEYPAINVTKAVQAVVVNAPQPPVKTDMEVIRDLLVTNARKEQQTFLQYVSDKELQSIHSCFDHPLHKKLVEIIRAGDWNKLLEEYKTNKPVHLHTILKAAYCQGKINLDELVSAYIFLAPTAAGQPSRIYRFDEISKYFPNVSMSGLLDRWKNINQIPPNLRYFIAIHLPDMEESDARIMKAFIRKQIYISEVAGGLRLDNGLNNFAMGSAALIRSDKYAQGLPPVFIRGLTPERADLIRRFEEGYSDYGILEPEEVENIHTASSKSLLPFAHDSFHLVTRVFSGLLQKKGVLRKALEMEQLLKTLPPYSRPSIVDKTTVVYPRLSAIATNDDMVRFIFDVVLSVIADGELHATKSQTDTNVIDKLIQDKVNHIQTGGKSMFVLCDSLNPHLKKVDLEIIEWEEF